MFLFASLFAYTGAAPEAEDPAAHACENVDTQEGTLVTGASTAEAPELPMDGAPYTATPIDGAPGHLAISVTEDTAALLFLVLADVAGSLWNGDEEVGLPEPAPNELCADDIPEHFDLDVHTAGTWTLSRGPAAVADVWISLAPAEGHGHTEGE